ncbi:surface antigen-like protein [Leptomonas pyrrhocoris]|uniref:Surface antigen-like protein n=1 Tax=Leptomonas pyrrhocoris TaxID=157538 RepID=A0A0N0VE86_LEPPY|nr:surface antigen-like protein [Leptomonas pyrrhocoris]XP_015656067.1 surface antigen-like protein [Leptomonas pyrrhocoris]KPA77627.1 surface antigen-like protein [Leptomonas pyrrhocoris]KPA77628.1 surface antigen-like protein [Leptomonas pyrrhocoris]|eukprot:XP_015656066.1 surface antigen-like protein [Leptomonas pyrrhocoris]
MSSVSNKFLVAVLAVLVLVASIAAAQGSGCQVPNCDACSPTSEFQCARCAAGYIMNGGQCSPATYCGVTNCIACVSANPNRCATCEKGYMITSSGLCAARRRNAAAAPTTAMWTAAAAAAVAVVYAL